MIKVFISSPYTLGDVAVNVKNQIDMANILMDLGFSPYAPLYNHFQHMAHPRSYEEWMEHTLCWVEASDCILRLDGESEGADREVLRASELGMPVFYSLKELCDNYAIKVLD
jgi:hypothetical protein